MSTTHEGEKPPIEEKDTDQETKFRTKDLDQAAFIWCQQGSKILGLKGVTNRGGRGQTIFFEFKLNCTVEQLAQLQLEYANGETLVEPQAFIAKQNSLRDLLHSSLGISNR